MCAVEISLVRLLIRTAYSSALVFITSFLLISYLGVGQVQYPELRP